MELNRINLKITAGQIVTESKLTRPAKKQLINFIEKEASDHQLMALLLDGEVTQVNDESKEILEQRFYNSEAYQVVQELVWFLAIPIYGAAGLVALKVLKNFMNEAKRKCGVIGIGKKRKACIAKTNVENLIACRKTDGVMRPTLTDWLNSLPDGLRKRLETLGMIELGNAGQSFTVAEWIRRYIDGRSDVKEATKRKWRDVENKLAAFFRGQYHYCPVNL